MAMSSDEPSVGQLDSLSRQLEKLESLRLWQEGVPHDAYVHSDDGSAYLDGRSDAPVLL
jgi:hypothetical protein